MPRGLSAKLCRREVRGWQLFLPASWTLEDESTSFSREIILENSGKSRKNQNFQTSNIIVATKFVNCSVSDCSQALRRASRCQSATSERSVGLELGFNLGRKGGRRRTGNLGNTLKKWWKINKKLQNSLNFGLYYFGMPGGLRISWKYDSVFYTLFSSF